MAMTKWQQDIVQTASDNDRNTMAWWQELLLILFIVLCGVAGMIALALLITVPMVIIP